MLSQTVSNGGVFQGIPVQHGGFNFKYRGFKQNVAEGPLSAAEVRWHLRGRLPPWPASASQAITIFPGTARTESL